MTNPPRPSILPELIDELVARCKTALPDVHVSDGAEQANNLDMGDYLWIGLDDPSSISPRDAAVSTQEWKAATYTLRREEGSITCAATTWRGDPETKLARDAAFAIASTVQGFLRERNSLSTPGLLWTSYTNQHLSQSAGNDGVNVILRFDIEFRAQL